MARHPLLHTHRQDQTKSLAVHPICVARGHPLEERLGFSRPLTKSGSVLFREERVFRSRELANKLREISCRKVPRSRDCVEL